MSQDHTPSRVGKGVPTGGQFAASTRHESEVTLADDRTGAGSGPFNGEVTPEFLDRCAVADADSIYAVGQRLAASPMVHTFWHRNAWSGTRQAVGDIIREARPSPGGGSAGGLTLDGDLVLLDANETPSEESMDWYDEPEKAARHRIHPDGLGITLFTPTGEPMRTHRPYEGLDTTAARRTAMPEPVPEPKPVGETARMDPTTSRPQHRRSLDTRAARVDQDIHDTTENRTMRIVRITPAGAAGTSHADGPVLHAKIVRDDGTLSDFTADIWDRSTSHPSSRYAVETD